MTKYCNVALNKHILAQTIICAEPNYFHRGGQTGTTAKTEVAHKIFFYFLHGSLLWM